MTLKTPDRRREARRQPPGDRHDLHHRSGEGRQTATSTTRCVQGRCQRRPDAGPAARPSSRRWASARATCRTAASERSRRPMASITPLRPRAASAPRTARAAGARPAARSLSGDALVLERRDARLRRAARGRRRLALGGRGREVRRSSAPTAPARRRCSTPSPATFRPPPGGSISSAKTSPSCRRTSASARACGAPTSLRCCFATSRCATTCSSRCAASRAAASASCAPRARPCVDAWPPHDLLERVRLTHIADEPVADLAHGQQRQLEIGMALAGAPRLILFDEPAAGLSPAERRELVALLRSLPRAHELRADRARPGHRAARGRARHRDAQRPRAEARHARRDRERRRRCRRSTWGASTDGLVRARARRRPRRAARCSWSKTSTSTTAAPMRCRA